MEIIVRYTNIQIRKICRLLSDWGSRKIYRLGKATTPENGLPGARREHGEPGAELPLIGLLMFILSR